MKQYEKETLVLNCGKDYRKKGNKASCKVRLSETVGERKFPD